MGAAITRFGLREQLMFPEIEYDKIDKVRGMEITIVTTARRTKKAAVCSNCWVCLSGRIR